MVEYNLQWSDLAKSELKKIFEYYRSEASEAIARKIRTSLFVAMKQLTKFPQSGTIESKLANIDTEFRYIIKGNYKIIYYLSDETVYITDVFDCRQDPIKINRSINN